MNIKYEKNHDLKLDLRKIIIDCKKELKAINGFLNEYKPVQKNFTSNTLSILNLTDNLIRKIPNKIQHTNKYNPQNIPSHKELMQDLNAINEISKISSGHLSHLENIVRKSFLGSEKCIADLNLILEINKSGTLSISKDLLKEVKNLKDLHLKNLKIASKMYNRLKFEIKINTDVKVPEFAKYFLKPTFLNENIESTYFPKYLKDFLSLKLESNIKRFDDSTKILQQVCETKSNKILYDRTNEKTHTKLLEEFNDYKNSYRLASKGIKERLNETIIILNKVKMLSIKFKSEHSSRKNVIKNNNAIFAPNTLYNNIYYNKHYKKHFPELIKQTKRLENKLQNNYKQHVYELAKIDFDYNRVKNHIRKEPISQKDNINKNKFSKNVQLSL